MTIGGRGGAAKHVGDDAIDVVAAILAISHAAVVVGARVQRPLAAVIQDLLLPD